MKAQLSILGLLLILSALVFSGCRVSPPPTPTPVPSTFEQTRELARELARISDNTETKFSNCSADDVSSIIETLEELIVEMDTAVDRYPNADLRYRKFLREFRDHLKDIIRFAEKWGDTRGELVQDWGITFFESLVTKGPWGWIPFLAKFGMDYRELQEDWKKIESAGRELDMEFEELRKYLMQKYELSPRYPDLTESNKRGILETSGYQMHVWNGVSYAQVEYPS